MADLATVKAQATNQEIPQKGIGAAGSEDALKKEKKLKKACADFESIFTYYMFKTMRQSIPQSGYLNRVPVKILIICYLIKRLPKRCQIKGKEQAYSKPFSTS